MKGFHDSYMLLIMEGILQPQLLLARRCEGTTHGLEHRHAGAVHLEAATGYPCWRVRFLDTCR